jgi:hypothetical protein
MEFKKILNSKATKVTAWVVLPTVLVGGFFAVKYFIDKRNKSKEEQKLNELRERYKNINNTDEFFEGIKYLEQPIQFGYDLTKLVDKKEIIEKMKFEDVKSFYDIIYKPLINRTEEENNKFLEIISKIYE